MILESDRINLYGLSLDQLHVIASGRNVLAHSMGWMMNSLKLNSKGFLDSINTNIEGYIIPSVEQNPETYLLYTHWVIHHIEDNKDIGGIGYSGMPDKNGAIGISFYIDKKYESLGLASEALSVMVDWLPDYDNLLSIIADTPLSDIAAQKVLRNNGFENVYETEECIGWKLKIEYEAEQ